MSIWRHSRRVRPAMLPAIFNSNRVRRFDTQIARLAVLYEDLRLETSAIKEHSITCLDVLDPEHENRDEPARIGSYRSHYFLRRSIGTLSEFANALYLLTEAEEFLLIKQSWDTDSEGAWSGALRFFSTWEGQIRRIRNDIGGHFGETAARFAIENLPQSTVGCIEIVTTDSGREPLLHFAKEICASSMFHHIPGEPRTEFNRLVETVFAGYQHAIDCVHILVAVYLWPRFGSESGPRRQP